MSKPPNCPYGQRGICLMPRCECALRRLINAMDTPWHELDSEMTDEQPG